MKTKDTALFIMVALTLSADAATLAPIQSSERAISIGTINLSSDSSIEEAVRTALIGSQRVQANNINVVTRDGVVYLSGQVPTENQLVDAYNTARGVPGVRGVINQLNITHNNKWVHNAIPDTTLTSVIKSKFINDPLIQSGDINVSTERGIVYLQGNVQDQAALVRASNTAAQVRGVKAVVNWLSIGSNLNSWAIPY
jgi:hyperosmotically inducible periplasmic protein